MVPSIVLTGVIFTRVTCVQTPDAAVAVDAVTAAILLLLLLSTMVSKG